MSEKTEQASSYKLKKAREKGQVSKSLELNGALSMLVFSSCLAILYPQEIKSIEQMFSQIFQLIGHLKYTPNNLISLTSHLNGTKLRSFF